MNVVNVCEVDSTHFADVDPNDVQVMRVDNLDFDPCAIDCMD